MQLNTFLQVIAVSLVAPQQLCYTSALAIPLALPGDAFVPEHSPNCANIQTIPVYSDYGKWQREHPGDSRIQQLQHPSVTAATSGSPEGAIIPTTSGNYSTSGHSNGQDTGESIGNGTQSKIPEKPKIEESMKEDQVSHAATVAHSVHSVIFNAEDLNHRRIEVLDIPIVQEAEPSIVADPTPELHSPFSNIPEIYDNPTAVLTNSTKH